MSLFSFPMFFTFIIFVISINIPPALLLIFLSLWASCISHLNCFGSHFLVVFYFFSSVHVSVKFIISNFCIYFHKSHIYFQFLQHSKKSFLFIFLLLVFLFFCSCFFPFLSSSCDSFTSSIWLCLGFKTIPIPFEFPQISAHDFFSPCSPW